MALQADKQAWFEQALTILERSGPIGRASVDYIRRRGTRLGFSRQRGSGASWFDWRRLRFGIFLNADYADRPSGDPWLCSLVAHEVRHLEQGLLEALSVHGELTAWQLQFDVLQTFAAAPAGHTWRELRALDPASRADLERGRELMKALGGPEYRIELLPLLPLPAELAHRLRAAARRLFRSA
jgi:hypothetical protein